MSKILGYVKAISKPNNYGFINICVANKSNADGIWVGVGKSTTFKGLELKKGMDVDVEYSTKGNFHNAETIAQVERKKSGGNKGGYGKPRDNTGVHVGHSLNGALLLVKHKKLKVLEEAKHVHDVTQKLKEEYAKANPTMSEYDAGAAVGNAVLNGCRIIGNSTKVTKDDLEKIARGVLEQVPAIEEYVRASQKAQEPEKEEIDDTPWEEDDDDSAASQEASEGDIEDLPF